MHTIYNAELQSALITYGPGCAARISVPALQSALVSGAFSFVGTDEEATKIARILIQRMCVPGKTGAPASTDQSLDVREQLISALGEVFGQQPPEQAGSSNAGIDAINAVKPA